MLSLSNNDVGTFRIKFIPNTREDTEEHFRFAMFSMKLPKGSILMEAMQTTLKQPYFIALEPHTYFMIFRLHESDIPMKNGKPITQANGVIQTRIENYECWNSPAEVSYTIINPNTDAIFCRKDIIKQNGDLIFTPLASQFVRKLLTCERDIIANFGNSMKFINSSLELFISNERWQGLVNEIGLMLAQKWLARECIEVH